MRSDTPDKTALQIMDPAQGVLSDIELAGVIADDDGIGQKGMLLDAAPNAPSVAIVTGSGVTFSAEMPSWSRCTFQAA